MATSITNWANARTQHRLNVPLLLVTMVVSILAATFLYFWHGYSMKLLSASFISRSTELAANNQYEKASLSLWRYLKIEPDDINSRILMAEYYDKSLQTDNSEASLPRAIELYYQAIEVASGQEVSRLRHRLAELLLDAGRLVEAELVAGQVEGDIELVNSAKKIAGLAAFAQIGTGKAKARLAANNRTNDGAVGDASLDPDPDNPGSQILIPVGKRLEIAVQANPGDPELAIPLAKLYRDPDNFQFLSPDQRAEASKRDGKEGERLADQLIDELVENSHESGEALLTRYRYRTVFDISGRDEDLMHALEIAPENADVNYESGLFKLEKFADLQELSVERAPAGPDDESKTLLADAESFLTKTIRLQPKFINAYQFLGDVFVLQELPDKAIEIWRSGLQACENRSPTLFLKLINKLTDLEKYAEAAESITQCDALLNQLEDVRSMDRARRRQLVEVRQSLYLLHATMLIKQGKHLEAAPLLRQVVNLDLSRGQVVVSALQMLAGCYSAAGMDEAAADCIGRASQERPTDPELWSLAAAAWMKANRPDLAVEYFGKLTTAQPSTEDWLQLAVARQAIELAKPQPSRNWSELDLALSKAKQLAKEAESKEPVDPKTKLQLELFDVSSRLRTDGTFTPAEAKSRIDAVAEGAADDPQLIQRLMMFYEQLGSPEKADLLRQKLIDASGNTSERFLAEANLLVTRGEMDAAKNLFQQALEVLPDVEKRRIEIALVELDLLRSGDAPKAVEELKKRWQRDRSDLSLLRRLALFSIYTGSIQLEPENWESDLPLIEEPGGSFATYLRAYRYLLKARNVAQSADRSQLKNLLESAAIAQKELNQLRPLWPVTHTLAGEIAEQYLAISPATQESRLIQAIDHYKTAMRLGERRPPVILKLVYLLFQKRQFIEANELLPMLGDPMNSLVVSALSQDIWINTNQVDRAVDLAKQMVDKRAKDDVNPLLCYGQVLVAKNDTKKAEEVFQQAITEGDQNSPARLLLYNLYLRTGEFDRAKQVMNVYLKLNGDSISEIDRKFIMAQNLEMVNDPQAEALFNEVMQMAPNDLNVLSRSAQYFARVGKSDEAIDILQRVRKLPGGKTPENRALLVTMLAERGTDSDWNQLEELLTDVNSSGDQQTAATRMYAALLSIKKAARNTERQQNLAQALKLLEEVKKDSNPSASSHMAFAMIYHQLKNIASDPQQQATYAKEAVQHYVSAANANDAHSGQIRLAISFLLNQSMLDEAERLISKRVAEEKKTAKIESLASLALQVRLLKKRDQQDRVQQQLNEYVESAKKILPVQRLPELYRAIGDACLNAELYSEADGWFKLGDDGSIEIIRKLSLSLMRQGKASVALRQVLELYKPLMNSVANDPTNRSRRIFLIQLVSSLLTTAKDVPQSDFEIAEPVLTDAEQKFSDVASVCNAIATVRLIQGNRDLAIRWFRQALVSQPDNSVLLNNLATTLSEDPADAEEALKQIELAIKAFGCETPALLDTKAMILFHNRPQEAEQLLRELEHQNADPRVPFHLAIVLNRLNKKSESREYYEKAIGRGLLEEVLTNTELSQLEMLREEFASPELQEQEIAK